MPCYLSRDNASASVSVVEEIVKINLYLFFINTITKFSLIKNREIGRTLKPCTVFGRITVLNKLYQFRLVMFKINYN